MRPSMKVAKALFAIGLMALGMTLTVAAQRTGSTRPAPTIQSADALEGTYRWNPAKSENVADVIKSTDGMTDRQRQEISGLLREDGTISITVRGSAVTLSNGKDSFQLTADGKTRSDTAYGANVSVRASLRGSELTVSRLTGTTDVTTVYSAAGIRDELKVTRRVTTSYLQETVFSESYYDRTGAVADNNAATTNDDDPSTYSSNDPKDRNGSRNTSSGSTNGSTTRRPPSNRPGNFVVPNGTVITGVLDNDIITGVTQENDRFRMTVNAPNEFKGAVITGFLTGVSSSGKVSGRAQVTFNFETIRLTNGRTYDFGGYINSITDLSGKTIKVDTEGTVKGDNQTKETAKRSGIGAGIGAVLGGIIGGGNGAVLGAIIGGGAGAGSVVMQGKDDIKLVKGTVINVQASAPR